MRIKLKSKYIEMDFDTKDIKMLSVPSKPKYHQVDLCLTNKDGKSMNVCIASLDFCSSENFEDAQKLGEEIARRWNECVDKK